MLNVLFFISEDFEIFTAGISIDKGEGINDTLLTNKNFSGASVLPSHDHATAYAVRYYPAIGVHLYHLVGTYKSGLHVEFEKDDGF